MRYFVTGATGFIGRYVIGDLERRGIDATIVLRPGRTMPPGFNNRPIGVFSTFFPARTAQILVNGEVASGKAWLEKRGDREASSACLAWSETWVKPR